MLTKYWRSRPNLEIKTRIAVAKEDFKNKKKNLYFNNMNLALRKRLFDCHVWSVRQNVNFEKKKQKIAAIELGLRRRMERVKWVD